MVVDRARFRELLSKAPTKKPPMQTVNWQQLYAKAVKAGKIFTSKTFHEEIVEKKINAGRAKMKLHEWADEEPPKVARIWMKSYYLWSFDPEDIKVYAERAT